MGSKALVRLLIVFAAVAAIALIVKLTGPGTVENVSGSGADREKVFPEFPEQVSKIRIRTTDDEVNLVKGEKAWEVAERGDHPAKQEDIVGFVRKVWDLKVIQAPEIGPSQFSRLQLLDPDKGVPNESATVVSFLDANGKELESLWLGKIYERNDGRPGMFGGSGATEAGRYVKPGDEEVVFLVDETFSDIEPDPAGWLAEDFFNVEKIKTIAINSKTREEEGDEWTEADNWKLTRDDIAGDFSLVGAKEDEELDATKVSSMKSAFSSPKFDDVVVGGEAKENQPDRTTYTVETFDGLTYTVKASKKNDTGELFLTYAVDGKFDDKRTPGEEETDEETKRLDQAFADNLKALREKLAQEKALAGKVYKVRGYVIDSITKKRSEILKGEEAPAPAGGPGAGLPLGFPQGLPQGLPPGTIKLPADGSGVPLVPPTPPANTPPAKPKAENPPPSPDKPKENAGNAEEPKPNSEEKPADAKPTTSDAPTDQPDKMPSKPAAEESSNPAAPDPDKPAGKKPDSPPAAKTDQPDKAPAKPAEEKPPTAAEEAAPPKADASTAPKPSEETAPPPAAETKPDAGEDS